jgi:hypothetical protein
MSAGARESYTARIASWKDSTLGLVRDSETQAGNPGMVQRLRRSARNLIVEQTLEHSQSARDLISPGLFRLCALANILCKSPCAGQSLRFKRPVGCKRQIRTWFPLRQPQNVCLAVHFQVVGYLFAPVAILVAVGLRPEWRADYFAANIGDPDGYNIEIAYKPWL